MQGSTGIAMVVLKCYYYTIAPLKMSTWSNLATRAPQGPTGYMEVEGSQLGMF